MVSRIEWTYRTADGDVSAAGSQISVEIYRDGELVADLRDEPGLPGQLSRPGMASRVASFASVGNDPEAVGGTRCEAFPNGVHGHLDVRFRVDGQDAWQIRGIESTVVRREIRRVFGTPEAYEWVDLPERFEFDGVGVIHADPCDGTSILELSY
jgi:hypothetical protein